MSLFEAILLGLIQGITEFFPISSSGHLIIAEQLLGIESDHGVFLNVLLHIGTLTAVLLVFRKDVKRLIFSAFGILNDLLKNLQVFFLRKIKKKDVKYRNILRTSNRRLLIFILVSSIPTALFGSILHEFVSSEAITLFIVGFGLMVTGLLLFVVELAGKSTDNSGSISWGSALTIGICQGFSVIPGISRFGSTLSAGLLFGLPKTFAVKYSFLIAIPTIIGAAVYELTKLPTVGGELTFGFVICSLFGAIVAFIAGSFAIKFMLWVVKNSKLYYFTIYCVLMGIVAIALNYML